MLLVVRVFVGVSELCSDCVSCYVVWLSVLLLCSSWFVVGVFVLVVRILLICVLMFVVVCSCVSDGL